MKLLLLSDKESEYLWDYYKPGRLDGIDIILSCGDLNSQYLSFLVTMTGKPLLYVHGNHDKTYDRHPPEGCDCVEDRLVTVKGLRILGLGGSIEYSGGPHQYTEAQMARRIRRAICASVYWWGPPLYSMLPPRPRMRRPFTVTSRSSTQSQPSGGCRS